MRVGKENGRPALVLAVLAVLLSAAGCNSGRYKVSGKVTYPDGTPVPEGTVIGQMGDGATSVTVQGTIQSDGSFTWGTEREGDGAKPGKYKIAVVGRALGDAELGSGMRPAVAGKYANPQTSGLPEYEVKAGKNEPLNLIVTRPGERKK